MAVLSTPQMVVRQHCRPQLRRLLARAAVGAARLQCVCDHLSHVRAAVLVLHRDGISLSGWEVEGPVPRVSEIAVEKHGPGGNRNGGQFGEAQSSRERGHPPPLIRSTRALTLATFASAL